MKIAIYARCSTAHNGQDPETQLIPLRQYAEARGLVVYREYVDVASGVQESRPQLDELIQDAKKRRFDALVVWKLDRLGRSLKHLILLLEELNALGVQFISYTEGMDTTTPAGKLLFGVIGSIAAFERDLIRERVKAGLNKAKKRGKILGRPKRSIDQSYLKALRNGGLSFRDISSIIGCSYSSVRRASLVTGTVDSRSPDRGFYIKETYER